MNQSVSIFFLCHIFCVCIQEQSSPRVEFESARHELKFAAERIAELEESLMGKQVALDSLVTENDRLREMANHHAQQQVSMVFLYTRLEIIIQLDQV